MGGASLAERLNDNGNAPLSKFLYQTVFFPDHIQETGFTIDPRSVLRMRIQRNEAAWANIRFESKIQTTKIYKEWAIEVLSLHNIADLLSDASVRNAVYVSLNMSITRSHADLELLFFAGVQRGTPSSPSEESSLKLQKMSR